MLTACGGGDSAPSASAWTIGPDNYSVGMPTHPDTVGEGFAFDFPMQPGHVNYVTRQGLTLTGAHAIHAVFQIDAAA